MCKLHLQLKNTIMKKHILFTCLLSITLIAGYSQQQQELPSSERQLLHEHRADSALAARGIAQIKQFITITPQQEAALFEAGVKTSQAKRNVFKNYWKAGSFPQEMRKADHLQDSLYKSILGEVSYSRFRDKLDADHQKKMQEIRARAAHKDSTMTTTKPIQHEK